MNKANFIARDRCRMRGWPTSRRPFIHNPNPSDFKFLLDLARKQGVLHSYRLGTQMLYLKGPILISL